MSGQARSAGVRTYVRVTSRSPPGEPRVPAPFPFYGVAEVGDESEDIINAYIGASFKFTDNLFGTVSYNFTQSDSDLPGRDYDRNRVSVGVRAEF